MFALLAGDFGIAVLCYVIASSAAVAADIVLDQTRMDHFRRMFAYWFVFGVIACAASCIVRPLTNREAMGLIFYLNNFVFRSVGFIIIITQTTKVCCCDFLPIICALNLSCASLTLLFLSCSPLPHEQLYIHVRDLGESGAVVRARLAYFFRLIVLGATAFALIYFQGVRRCILLFNGLYTLPYFDRTRPFDLSAVGKLVLMSATLLFVSRVTVCASFEAPVDDRRYSQLNDEKPSLRLRSAVHASSDSVGGSVAE